MATITIISQAAAQEDSTAFTLTNGYKTFVHTMEDNADGDEWTNTNFSQNLHGYRLDSTSAGDEARTTQFYALLEATAPVPDPTDPPVLPPIDPPDPTNPDEREISGQLIFNWNLDGVTWVEEIENLISLRGEHSIVPPNTAIESSQGIMSTMTVVLKNNINRYNAMRTDAELSLYTSQGKSYHVPVIFQTSKDGGQNWERVFTGVVKIPVEQAVTTRDVRTVTYECRSNEEKYINDKLSTSLSDFNQLNGATESTIMDSVLTDLGLTSPSEYALDAGTWSIPYFFMHEDSVISTLWQLASSVGGRFYANKFGVFVYENNQHWLGSPHDVPRESFMRGTDGLQRYSDFRIRYDDVNLSKTVTVTATIYSIQPEQVVYEVATLGSVLAGETKIVEVEFPNPVVSIGSVSYQVTTSVGGSGSATVNRTDLANGVSLEIINTSAQTVFIKNFKINATPVRGDATAEIINTSSNAFWNNRAGRTRSISNSFIRDGSQASFVSSIVLSRQEVPVATFVLGGCPGDGARAIGDHIRIYDDSIMTGFVNAHIVKLQWTYSFNGFYQNIEAIERSSLFPFGGNDGSDGSGPTDPSTPPPDNDYFIINESLLGGADVLYY